MPELKPWQRPRQLWRQLPKPPAVKLPQVSGKLKTWQLTAGAATVGLAISAGAVAAAGPWDSSGQRTAEREWAASQEAGGGADHAGRTPGRAPGTAPSAPSVLAGLGAPAGKAPVPTGRALADVLDPIMKDPALGPDKAAVVVDAASGKRVYDKHADKLLTPASTIKIATAVAALSSVGPDHRITTKTVIEPDTKEVVLVGGGDPTLTARKEGRYTDTAASLRALAEDTARALKARDVDEVTLSYDTSLYSGPPLHPISPNENITPVSALMVDEGRLDDSSSGPATRTEDPAGDAVRKFEGFLKDHGIRTTGQPGPSKASGRAESLAKVESPPLSFLVERMLTHSDNDIAEHLARQTAIAAEEPASFDGAGKATRAALEKLELPVGDAEFADGSGLDRADRASALLLTELLDRAADPGHPALRPVLTGLPIAGFTGTLVDRYPKDSPGTGLVRAKTGTLTGVNTLSGTVVDADGRLLVFAFMTTGTTDADGAQKALDHMASAVANCGCRA
ncbi:D-alanyl-D-alanine carboxypeptidase/D-alanyl-D-alanine-endopeptidase [Streptomyces sp. NPDC087300]|uniref:D-alanyl-D-alanine carboxypeptidase/D-alanyl-D-alanine endopeptidase n=1 Tax=Streptomyces sp. NPDC087300 TaxID=3365780 RepID=UPI00380964F1